MTSKEPFYTTYTYDKERWGVVLRLRQDRFDKHGHLAAPVRVEKAFRWFLRRSLASKHPTAVAGTRVDLVVRDMDWLMESPRVGVGGTIVVFRNVMPEHRAHLQTLADESNSSRIQFPALGRTEIA